MNAQIARTKIQYTTVLPIGSCQKPPPWAANTMKNSIVKLNRVLQREARAAGLASSAARGGASADISANAGVCTKLKKYSNPIQVIPDRMCAARESISPAPAGSKKSLKISTRPPIPSALKGAGNLTLPSPFCRVDLGGVGLGG